VLLSKQVNIDKIETGPDH